MLRPSTLKIIFCILLSVVVCFLGSLYIRNIKSPGFFVDEYYFIKKSYYFDLFFLNRNVDDPRFTTEDEFMQPKVGPYVYGAALHLYGAKNIEEFLDTIHFNEKNTTKLNWWEELWNKNFDTFPNNMNKIVRVILFERKVSIFLLMLSFILVYVIAHKTSGILFATISTFLVGINKLTRFAAPLATTDSMLMFFSFLSIFLTFLLTQTLDRKYNVKLFVLSFMLGLSVAMGVGVKISGILILFFVVLVYLGLFCVNWKKKLIKNALFISLATTFVSFCVVFVFLHPYLYKDTLHRFPQMFLSRMEGTKLAQVQYPGTSVVSRMQAFKIISRSTLLPRGAYTNFSKINFPVDIILFLLGFYLMLRESVAKLKKFGVLPLEMILAIWFIVMFVGLVMYLRNSWSRYFLECELIITIIESYAIVYFIKVISKLGVLLTHKLSLKN